MDNPAITAYVLVVAGVLGLVLGSFINCWAWRSLHGESIVRGRSHCTSCSHVLAARDLIPVVSWLMTRGTCRYCGSRISIRYLLAEVLCAACFVGVVAVYGLQLQTLELLAFVCILLFLSLTDIEKRLIPNGCILAALGVRAGYLAVAFALGQISTTDVLYYVASGLGVGVVMLVLVLVADRLFGRESMGGGDLKLFALAGFYFGWQQTVLLVLIACIYGIIVALATSGKTPDEEEGVMRRTIPFGPSIAAACVTVMLLGEPVVMWYLNLF